MANGQVKLNLNHVLVRLNKASEPMAGAIALQIQARTKLNITRNGQIDTGFMRNSAYTVTRKSSTYGQANPSGNYQSGKQGKQVKRHLAREAALPGDALAATAVGASHAIWQEEKRPFLYPACVDAAKDAGVKAKAQKVFQENLHD